MKSIDTPSVKQSPPTIKRAFIKPPPAEALGSVLPKLAYSMQEAAQVLGVSYMSMHRLIKRGLIRSSSAFRTKVIPHGELERFLKATLE